MRVPVAALFGAACIAAGFLLRPLHPAFLVLVAAGAFGPGVLAQLGWLPGRDEFQIRVTAAAGHHAYVAAGLVAVVLLATHPWSDLAGADEARAAVDLLLLTMLVTYLISYLFHFWGARTAAFRLLVTFGSIVLLFVVLSHATQPVVLLVELAVPVPILALAFASRHWPRISGTALLALAGFALFFFHLLDASRPLESRWVVIVALVVPMAAAGAGLIASEMRGGSAS